MLPDNNIQNELKTLGCTYLTAGLPMPFRVPNDYFNALPGAIVNQVKATDHTPYAPLPHFLNTAELKQVPYKVPAGYFDLVAGHVFTKIEQDAAIDQSLKSSQQEVPAGYFDSLADNIMTRVKASETPVVNLTPRKKSWLKYAVAAAVTGLVALASIVYFTSTPADNTSEGTASIDVQVSKSLQSVPEHTLEQMVTTLTNETVPEKATLPATSNTAAKTEALVAGLLNEIPTAELASFLTDFDEDADEELSSTLN